MASSTVVAIPSLNGLYGGEPFAVKCSYFRQPAVMNPILSNLAAHDMPNDAVNPSSVLATDTMAVNKDDIATIGMAMYNEQTLPLLNLYR